MSNCEQLISLFQDYFPQEYSQYFINLPVPVSTRKLEFTTVEISLPEWADNLGVGSPPILLVPESCVCQTLHDEEWRNVDWWRAAFELMTCQAEIKQENINGSIHSYSSKLPSQMASLWERAWVNRIFLFLRRWVSYLNRLSEEELLSQIPKGSVYLTHDVDYVSKTLALRFKQSAFIIYNFSKSIIRGDLSNALTLLEKLFRFSLGGGDYWQFPRITEIENKYGVTSSWNFYGGVGGFKRSLLEMLLDPSYCVFKMRLREQLKSLSEQGHNIGLHQGFFSWDSSDRMIKEKQKVESSIEKPINSCRQHWLRFSFKNTWKAQEEAGFLLDSTLGFNDRPGFRNSAALKIPAWISGEQRFSESLNTLPMVLMDSHLFDYQQVGMDERRKIIDSYLDEIAFVGGQATIIWHQRVFHRDYAWDNEYEYLLEGIKQRNLQVNAENFKSNY